MLNKKALAASLSAKETDADFKQTVLLLHGDGTNGAQNNTFTDSSTNAFTITRNGNTTQGTFSPFSQTGWSNYLATTSERLTTSSSSNAFSFGTGDFTVEGWVNLNSVGSNMIFQMSTASTGYNASLSDTVGLYVDGAGKLTLYANNTGTDSTNIVVTSSDIGQWRHFAIVRSSGTTKLYWNGSEVAGLNSISDSVNYSMTYCVIGTVYNNTYSLKGYLSNFRTLKGTAQYSGSTYTVPTTELTAITNTSFLIAKSNRFVDVSSNSIGLTASGSPSVQAFSPFAPTDAYSAATNGGSGYFDGTGDYLSVADNTALTLTGDHTIESLVYLTAYNANYSTVVARWQASGTEEEFLLWIGPTGTVEFYFRPFGAGSPLLSGGTVSLNSWTHIAVVRSGNDWALFVNGSRVATASNSGTYSNTAAILTVGSIRPTYTQYDLAGYISNLRLVKGTAVYSPSSTTITVPTAPLTAVTNTSLLLNFTNAGIIDQTGKNNLETVGNAQIDTGTKKFGTGSLEFDGNGDYLARPSTDLLNFGTGDFTIEFWLNAAAQTVDYAGVISNSTTSGWGLRVSGTGLNKLQLTNGATANTSTGVVADSTWKHIAISRSGSSLRMFIDGSLDSTHTNSNSIGFAVNEFRIGRGFTVDGNDGYFTGFVDDLRITKGLARYTAAFTAPTKAFADQ